jgi:hypothetical protein
VRTYLEKALNQLKINALRAYDLRAVLLVIFLQQLLG